MVCDTLISFLPMQKRTSRFISELLVQNFGDCFKHVLFTVQGSPGELLL
jgi:hypothetical protein